MPDIVKEAVDELGTTAVEGLELIALLIITVLIALLALHKKVDDLKSIMRHLNRRR